MKSLSKKLVRDILSNKSQFITIFLMVFLGVFVFSGIHAYMDGMKESADKYYENNNLQDIWVVSENISKDDLIKLKDLDNVKDVERKLVINTTIKDTDINIDTNFIESNNISKFYVKDGTKFSSDKKGVWLDYYLAKNRGYNVGDEITLKYQDYEIKEEILGLIETPDHVYAVKDETEIFPNHNNFGYAYLNINEFPEEYIIDNIIKEMNIPSREMFDILVKDFNKEDYYIFNNAIIDIDDTSKLNETKKIIEENIKDVVAVTDRDSSLSYSGYNSEIEEGDTYSGVFTMLFLFIAILSVVTTMNRFVKKQRTQIGTLKALGLKKLKIVKHYISFGVYISLIASALGVVAGAFSLGPFFLNMEMEYFEIPEYSIVINPIVYIMAIVVVLVTTLVTYLSCRKILKESAADALRINMPKVKKAKFTLTSKGILKNLSVSNKWNLRDMTRNKGRSIMAIVGIIGCTMLLVCAFGMLDTMNSYLDWEFNKLCNFDYKLSLKSDYKDSEFNEIVTKYGNNTSQTIGIEIENGDNKEPNTIVVNNALDYLKYTDHNKKYIDIDSSGIWITEKLAKKLHVSVGDEVKWHKFGEDKWYISTISGLNRDPQNQNVNMTKEYLESLGVEYRADTMYLKEKINEENIPGVNKIQDISTLREGMENMLSTLKTVIVILILVAIILGFVIIYNLGVLSLSEKEYQFATLKVLGFSSKKIKRIFTKQNVWLAIIGIIIGLPCGYFMVDFIFKMALSDSYDFNAYVKLFTYLYAIVGIIIVTFFVNKFLSKKVNKIDMVSSLKSNE